MIRVLFLSVVLMGSSAPWLAKGPSPAEIKKHSSQTLKVGSKGAAVACPVSLPDELSAQARAQRVKAAKRLAASHGCSWVYDAKTLETVAGTAPDDVYTIETGLNAAVTQRVGKARAKKARSRSTSEPAEKK